MALSRRREGAPAGKWHRGREAGRCVGWWLRCRRLDPQPGGLWFLADPSSVLHFHVERAAVECKVSLFSCKSPEQQGALEDKQHNSLGLEASDAERGLVLTSECGS